MSSRRSGGKKHKVNIINKDVTKVEVNTVSKFYRAVACATNSTFDQCLMLICSLFASIDRSRPREVDLDEVIAESTLLSKKLSTFDTDDWNIKYHDKEISGYKISASNKLDDRYETLNFEMFTDLTVLVDNFKKWFSIEHHEMSILKCLSQLFGVVKCEEKFYVFNPNNGKLQINSHHTCVLTECSDFEHIAEVIQNCLKKKESVTCEFFCVNLFSASLTSNSTDVEQIGIKLQPEEALQEIKEITEKEKELEQEKTRKKDAEHRTTRSDGDKSKVNRDRGRFCKSGAKREGFKGKKTVDIVCAKKSFTVNCNANTNYNQFGMHVYALFSLININETHTVNLERAIRISESSFDDSFTLDNEFIEFRQGNETYLTYRIIGLAIITCNPYAYVYFDSHGDKAYIENCLNQWFTMGYNNKTLLKFSTNVLGILKTDLKYYLFDSNVEGNLTNQGKASCEFFTCDDISELVEVLQCCLNKKPSPSRTTMCTLFAINTLQPIISLGLYVTSDENYDKRRSTTDKTVKAIADSLDEDQEVQGEETRLINRKYKARSRSQASQEERKKILEKERAYKAHSRQEMAAAEIEKVRKKQREYEVNKRKGMTEAEIEDNRKKHREYEANKIMGMTEAEIEDARKKHREYEDSRRKEIEEAEKEKCRKKEREQKASKKKAMTEAEIEEARKNNRIYHITWRNNMTAEEKEERRRKQREYKVRSTNAMTDEENAEFQKKKRENEARRRKEMTAEEKESAKDRAKESLKKHKEHYKAKNELNASIRKLLKFKGKKETITDNLIAALGGSIGSRIQAQQLVAANLRQRQAHLNAMCPSLTSLFFTMKKRKEASDLQEDITDKFMALMGPSLHTSESGAYFVDSTYKPMPTDGVYSLNEVGQIMDLFEPLINKANETVLRKWHCNEMCKIDQDSMYKRFYYIIEEMLKAKPDELLGFIEKIDECATQDRWTKYINDKDETSEFNVENCGCDFCEPSTLRRKAMCWTSFFGPCETSNLKKYKVTWCEPNYLRTYPDHEFKDKVFCDLKDDLTVTSGEAGDCGPYDARKMGHPHACYINYRDNYGCNSVLLFLRTLSPHYPFIRKIVSELYKAKKRVLMIKAIDSSLEQQGIEHLKEIRDNVVAKARDNFQYTVEWPYAHEDEIKQFHIKAFKSLEKKNLDVPIIPCFSCLKLCSKADVTAIGEYYPKKVVERVWGDLEDYHAEESHTYDFICTYCKGQFKAGKFPPTCILNGLQVKSPPTCITQLNDYEKIFIQRAKAFQVVTRMGSVSGKNKRRGEMIQKVKGRTFHLPLPLEKTLEKMPTPQQAIIPQQDLYILVRGQPTKQKQVWQQFINVNRVYKALRWLKLNNPLYGHIILPGSAANILDELDDVDVQFDFEKEAEANENEEAMLTQKDKDDSFYEHVTIHSLDLERPNEDPSTIYQMKNVTAKSIDSRAEDLDIRCFPDLFCYGENGQDSHRGQHLGFAEYVKARLKSVHSQFRLNIQYLFFLLSIVNLRQIYSGIYTTLNTTANVKNLNAGQLRTNLKDKQFDVNACSIFSRLRNSYAFWKKPRNDINCMVRAYGPASFFLTFSPSEWNWIELEKYLREVNGDKAKGKSASALIAMDPVSTSRFIDNKFKAMLEFLTSEKAPLGKIIHYAWRREYQSRGLQHFHLMLWVHVAPVLGTSTDEEVINFVSKYITCHIPDDINFPTLHSRVMQYQQHHHNKYCQRSKKNKKGQYVTVCRFGFSRPISSTFVLRDLATSIHGRRQLKLKSRLYDLPRTAEEIDVNDYNPVILMAWEGNMDIQYIGEKTCALSQYITKYTTKGERSSAAAGFSDIASSKPLFTKLWMMGQRMLTTRECGALEAADTLLGISLHGTDKDTTIQWLDVRTARNRKLKQWQTVSNMEDEETDLFFPSMIDTHYPNRPSELKDLCLYNFVQNYNIVVSKPQSKTAKYYAYGKLFVVERPKPRLINHYDYKLEKEKENYYFALLLLFKPFTIEADLLGAHKSYEEAYEFCKHELKQAEEYHEKMQTLQRNKTSLDDQIRELEIQDEVEEEEENNSQNVGHCDPIDDAVNDIRGCITLDNVTTEAVDAMIAGLNVDQLRIFNSVKDMLIACKNKVAGAKVLRRFISGVGGVGKSHLIKVIRLWAKAYLQSDVIVIAPTGIASSNVEGLTIHRLLRLPVQHDGSTPKYEPLSDDALQKLRNVLKDVLLIIIDEISMASNVILLFIHLRLQEVYNTFQKEDGWFGFQNIISFGDFLQLPPVKAAFAFATLKKEEISKHHKSLVADINLWVDLFDYDELTINVRQESDSQFAELLSRIRLGYVTRNDEEMLRNRQIKFNCDENNYKSCLKQVIEEYQSLPDSSVCLFPLLAQCKEQNDAMLTILPGPEIIIHCKDKIDGGKNIQRKTARDYLSKLSNDNSKTGALEETLRIKKGSKVMLRRNIDSKKGLVNGAIGTIKDINSDTGGVTTLNIAFSKGDYLLERLEVKFQIYANVYVIRSQFPITLAYGITIHKSQSLSLEHALIDIGQSVFCDGQTYVALSRLTSLEGLHIVNFDPKKVTANVDAINEYNRLRRLYRPDLEQIQIVRNTSYSTPDTIWWEPKLTFNPGPNDDDKNKLPWIPGFENRHNNCFANSALQCLLSCKSINSEIMKSNDDTLKELTILYNNPQNEVLNSDKIIESVRLTLGPQQDTVEFMSKLCEVYPHVSTHFRFKHLENIKCTTNSCNYKQSIKNNAHFHTFYHIPTIDKKKPPTIHDIMKYNYRMRPFNAVCPTCNENNLVHNGEIADPNKYLILVFNVFIQVDDGLQIRDHRIDLQVNNLPTSVLNICGSQYTLKSAIFHTGDSGTTGHYVSYIKLFDGWRLVSDKKITKTRWARGSKDVYVLFYERK